MNSFICEREAAHKAPKEVMASLRMRLERHVLFIFSIHTRIFVTRKRGKQMENLSNTFQRF